MTVVASAASQHQQQNNDEYQHGLFLEHLFDLTDLFLNAARNVFALPFRGQFGIVGDLPRCFFNLALQFVNLAFDFVVCTLCHSSGKASLGPSGSAYQRPSACPVCVRKRSFKQMLWTIFVILLVLWLLGLVTSYTLGGFVHILLILAVVVLVIQLLQGRRSIL